jgi:PKD repeat protein
MAAENEEGAMRPVSALTDLTRGAFFAAILMVAGISGFHAQVPAWAPAGWGGGGNFTGLCFDPAHPGVVYATSDVSGVYRSANNGDLWENRSTGLGNMELTSFAVDPFDSDTLYAGTGSFSESNRAGMYKSTDAGLNWIHLPETAAKGITFRRYRTADCIAPDPSQQGVLLSGSRQKGIWRTENGGATWSQVLTPPTTSSVPFDFGSVPDDPPGPPWPAPVSVLYFEPGNPSVAWAGLDGAGVWRSSDRGLPGTWQSRSTGLPSGATVWDIGFGPTGTLWAALREQGIYRSINGGATWTSVLGDIPTTDLFISSVVGHPTDPKTAYLTFRTYIFESAWKTVDGGVHWVQLGNVTRDAVNNPTRTWSLWPTWTWRIEMDPANPQRLFYTDFWSIFRSDDGGASFFEKILKAQNTCVTSVTVEPDASGPGYTLWATHMDTGLYASSDKGATWRSVMPTEWTQATVGHYWDFAIAKSGSTKYYLTALNPSGDGLAKIFRSGDGTNWSTALSVPSPGDNISMAMAVHPTNLAIVYAAQQGGAIYKSTNAGASWAPTSGQPDNLSFRFGLAVDGLGRVFVGTIQAGLYRSTDGGTTWGWLDTPFGSVFNLLATSTGIFAATDQPELFHSTDGGDTWTAITSLGASDDGDGLGLHGMAISADPSNANHIFFGRVDSWYWADAGDGLWESTDGGANWSHASQGLGIPSVYNLAVAPDGALFAGTWCANIWSREVRPCALSCAAAADPIAGQAPLSVQFTGSTTAEFCAGSPSFSWSFGDGGTSAEQNPSHTYASAGTYSWTLTVAAGDKTCTQGGSITVSPPPCTLECTAAALPSSGEAPLSVTFASTVTPDHCIGLPTYSWTFGDDGTSSEPDPTYTYATAGTFSWTMTVTADDATCTGGGSVTVTIPPCTLACTAHGEPAAGAAPLSVSFTATATPDHCSGPPSYSWTFGDGGTSSEQNPEHTYTAAGTYSWTLTAAVDGVTCSKGGTIAVSPPPIPGDCDGSGEVTIGEVQKAINMFLETLAPGCGVDCNGDGSVSIGEVQKVINAFLGTQVAC